MIHTRILELYKIHTMFSYKLSIQHDKKMIFKFVFSTILQKPVIQKDLFQIFYKQTMNSLNFMFLSQVDFSHVSFSGCISKTRHGWNRRTMKSRVLSGRSISRSLSLFASAVQ
ncbi:hypothetical protein HanPI659440_Chr02g0048121 [Helianthus annuus]|nr:hypothetical protein HanPI659440_Chr02g0048121 [Helianthus annuus]